MEALRTGRNYSVGVPHVRTSVRGPKTTFFECFHSRSNIRDWLNLRRMHRSEYRASSLDRHFDIRVGMSSAQKSRLKL